MPGGSDDGFYSGRAPCGHADCADSWALAEACRRTSLLAKPEGLCEDGEAAYAAAMAVFDRFQFAPRGRRVFLGPREGDRGMLLRVSYVDTDVEQFFEPVMYHPPRWAMREALRLVGAYSLRDHGGSAIYALGASTRAAGPSDGRDI